MNRSETISEIAKALAKFNGEVTKIDKNADNPFFKSSYSTLDHIIEQIRPILTKHGLSILQIPSGDGQNVVMKTLLLHESGEFLESDELIMKPVKNDPQGIGSAVSYARRYSLCSFLSLSTGDTDDDGNTATFGDSKPSKQQQPQNNQSKKISENQSKMLNSLISRMEKEKQLARDLTINGLKTKPDIGNFNSIPEMTVSQASTAIKYLQKSLEGHK